MIDTSESANPAIGWVFGILGTWIAVSLGAILHLYERVSRCKASEAELTKLWTSLETLRSGLERDRERASNDRREIAERMVTREELNQSLDRVVQEIRNRRGGGWDVQSSGQGGGQRR